MSSSLESEDLENIQLVRMEDVQPSRDRPCETIEVFEVKDEDLEIVEELDYDNECIVDGNDDDSNIGSMVSIQADEVAEDEIGTELIVPDIVGMNQVDEETDQKFKKAPGPESWPTLEILPGGVINNLEKYEDDLNPVCSLGDEETERDESGSMMYACAKCPQRFQFLCSLVKHVRVHAPGPKKFKEPNISTLCVRTKRSARMPQSKYVVVEPLRTSPALKTYKRKVVKILPKKPAS